MKEANRQEHTLASEQQRVEIDFMYIDLQVCDRCLDTYANLESALSEVSHILEASGAEVSLRKTLIKSESQAQALGFLTSPTIRINDKDIALELRESNCEPCSCNGAVDCRVWVFQVQEYMAAPKAMIVDAILREVYGNASLPQSQTTVTRGEVPENLRRFFAVRAKEGASEATSCCSTTELTKCCEPSEKAECCGTSSATSCGCK
ncbi:MAG: DUF2703 domain-containing protein [Thermodesulfobacteriota bacterium]